MKRILMLLLLCGSFFYANAVSVSGNITTNTTWTLANSPYIVNGDLTVDSGVVLTIQPGVEVRVDSTYIFQVDGKLLAVGTSADTIKFTANSANHVLHPWNGITFTLKSVDTSKLQYCRFTYADVAIYTTGAKLRISNSTFKHNNIGIHINSIQFNSSNYTYINKCLVTQNDTGIYDSGNWLINSMVTENEISFNYIGLREENSRQGLRNFNYNHFNYNTIGYSASGSQFGSRRNTYRGNTLYGVYFAPSTPDDLGYISENTFVYNATAIYIDNVTSVNVYANTIAYNGIGIDDNFSYTGTISSNSVGLFSNCYLNNTFYNYKQNGSIDRSTRNDWWGTTNTLSIDSSIYDFYDNSTKGKVVYTSIATSSFCQSVAPPPPCFNPNSLNVVATSPNNATATWAATSGAAGYEYYIIPLSSSPPSMGVVTTTTSVNLNGLTGGEKYVFCVRTKCQSSPFLSAWVCDTVTMPCGAPAYVIFNNISANSAIVWWGATTGATSYEYYVAPHPSTPPLTASTTTNNVAIVNGLSPNTTYDVCVRGKCGSYYSAWKCDTLHTVTGIDHIDLQDAIRVFPNPNTGTFTVSLDEMSNDNTFIVLYDVTGRVMMSKKMSASEEMIELQNAAKGVYLLRIVTGDAVINKRVVVE
ncbi:MAG: T9SS type A sorting domain-containing protein [Taibaiella sp.]|nr:T9SS type A sorting domain-containing protein [Taibaiella sp.]